MANFSIPLRILEIILSLTIVGLMAYVAHFYNDTVQIIDFPDFYIWVLFSGAWGFIMAVVLLVLGKSDSLNKSYIVFALDIFAAMILFASFIALALIDGSVNCESPSVYGEVLTMCRVVKATIAMCAFAWFSFIGTSIISFKNTISTVRGTSPA